LPRSGVVKFVGRAEKLEHLHTQLQQSDRIAITAIAGMGGIGKTELALQYAIDQKNQGYYPAGLCWLRARDREIATELLTFAQTHLGLSIPEQLEIDAQVRFCWRMWPQGEALIVLDDVTDYQAIKPYLPPADPRFKLLITTRLDLGSTVQKIAIEELDEDGAIALLESLVGGDRVRSQLADAQALCKWVGYLPLALELLGRFLARKLDWSIDRLLKALDEKRLAVKALVETENGMTGQLSVVAALELSWKELNEAEQELACLLGMFAIAPIPWSLVKICQIEIDLDELEDTRDDGLIARSLLKRVSDGSYQLHQIVQEYFRIKLEQRFDRGQAIKSIFCQVIGEIAKTIDESPMVDQVKLLRDVIIHIEEGIRSWSDSIVNEDLIILFIGIARFHQGQGDYSFTEHWYSGCLQITKKRFGNKHPDIAQSLSNLAGIYYLQGRYAEAEPLYYSSSEMYQQLFGEENSDFATSLNNLAALYSSQGRYKDAEHFYHSALRIYKHLFGENHPNIAKSLNNLAALYLSQGRCEEAEPLCVSSMAMMRLFWEDDHPDITKILSNLAGIYRSQCRYAEAEPLLKLVLERKKNLLGESHPDIALSLNNLALNYRSQERYEEAETLLKYSSQMYARLLGDDCLYVAMSQWNIGGLYHHQGKYSEAKVLYCQALITMEARLGFNHPHTQGILNSLNSLPQP
jgi:tetratricopeptide (TPR) repeat protein